jgi:hypothetical protein
MSTWNRWQHHIIRTYAGGEFSHVTDMNDVRDCGDTLFTFLMSELDEDDLTQQEALSRIQNAYDELGSLLVSVADLNSGRTQVADWPEA